MRRIVFIDYIRVVACFLVILVHASENFYESPNGTDMVGSQAILLTESHRLWIAIYDGISRISVPLFIIVSAYLLVPMKEGETMFGFYAKRARRILPPFLTFLVLYSTLPLIWGQLDTNAAITDLSRILLNFPSLAGHFWFMYPLIGLYLFIPIISGWLRHANPREELFFIGLFAISTCMPYLNLLFGELWGQCFWNEYHMLWYFSGYLGYLVLAHYIRVHLKWSTARRMAIGSLAFITGTLTTVASFYFQAVPEVLHETPMIELGWTFCTINCVVATSGAFLMFSCIKESARDNLVTEISELSYGMYLMHIFWLGLWVSVIKDNMPIVAAIPAIAVATYASCYLTAKVISMLPGSIWIIGAGKGLPSKSTAKA